MGQKIYVNADNRQLFYFEFFHRKNIYQIVKAEERRLKRKHIQHNELTERNHIVCP